VVDAGEWLVVDLIFVRLLVQPWVLASVAWVIGFAVPAVFVLQQRYLTSRRVRHYRRRAEQLETELNELRNAPLEEPIAKPALPAGSGGAATRAGELPGAAEEGGPGRAGLLPPT